MRPGWTGDGQTYYYGDLAVVQLKHDGRWAIYCPPGSMPAEYASTAQEAMAAAEALAQDHAETQRRRKLCHHGTYESSQVKAYARRDKCLTCGATRTIEDWH